ncbi:ketosteroid isomerase [Pedobacter petrophilus]|uniref:Ketosteroid isomerase n=2 Tax=Pedobacter TaxID=84567 RepID=A0A7K0G688_9SPHI|nr:ester cyclase [Pedobacter petrophilus]MRX78506.1 ketosteroid isomerase [Pedobacter petrophilus]
MKTASENENIIRELYRVAEIQDLKAFVDLFSKDGYFLDVSSGIKYQGQEIGEAIKIYAKAFPDMHRELFEFYVNAEDNVVIVELALQGTHKGPLQMPLGTIPSTNKKINVPCCDVFHMENGKVKSFHCYNIATELLAQIGVLSNLSEVVEPS